MGQLNKRFLDTTRGQIVSALRRKPSTVEELASTLGLTDNAIRAHLVPLERDGLVRQAGVRRGPGAGKPATLYEIPPEAEPLFSRAYVPVLQALLDEIATRLPNEKQEELLRGVGHRLAADMQHHGSGSVEARASVAASLLDALGGDAQIEQGRDGITIRGCGCPLSAATSKRPEVCKAVETLLSEVTGLEFREQCDRKDRPQCCFYVQSAERTH
jgi:predicted ArsR family transcriptional regulator